MADLKSSVETKWIFTLTFLVNAVTMQAQRVAPPDLQCKDKFLIQCTVIPFGTTEQEITSEMVRSYKLLGVAWS